MSGEEREYKEPSNGWKYGVGAGGLFVLLLSAQAYAWEAAGNFIERQTGEDYNENQAAAVGGLLTLGVIALGAVGVSLYSNVAAAKNNSLKDFIKAGVGSVATGSAIGATAGALLSAIPTIGNTDELSLIGAKYGAEIGAVLSGGTALLATAVSAPRCPAQESKETIPLTAVITEESKNPAEQKAEQKKVKLPPEAPALLSEAPAESEHKTLADGQRAAWAQDGLKSKKGQNTNNVNIHSL